MPKKAASIRIVLLGVYVLILAAIIFLAGRRGTRAMLNFVGDIPYGDKLGHFLLMGGFSFLLNLALDARSLNSGKSSRLLLGSLIAAAIVTAEEISQLFVSGRTFDWGDLVYDYLGIFLFGELARLICRKKSAS